MSGIIPLRFHGLSEFEHLLHARYLKSLRLLPELTLIRNAWRARFSVHGCVSCRRKKTHYGGGGFCYKRQTRITTGMRICFRKMTAGRDIPDEVASLSRRYDVA